LPQRPIAVINGQPYDECGPSNTLVTDYLALRRATTTTSLSDFQRPPAEASLPCWLKPSQFCCDYCNGLISWFS